MKAVIYARYSSDNQREESITAQVRACTEYAERQGYTVVKVYTDEARSAQTDDRPGILHMIADIKAKRLVVDVVLVHKLDRFARNRYDSAFYKRELRRAGVRVESVLERLDDSPESVLLESLIEGMFEYYSKNLAREVMKGMKETAFQCKHTGGTPPLGYDVDKERNYIVNEAEAEAVRLIFSMYADGYSYNRIIDELNKRGLKTKTGRPFGKNSIHDTLRNKKYAGYFTFNRSARKSPDGKRNNHASKPPEEIIEIPGGIPAIVTEELFRKAQARLERNRRLAQAASGSYRAREAYLLSGLIYCGKCDSRMVGTSGSYHTRVSREYRRRCYYHCNNAWRTKQCSARKVNKEEIEAYVIERLEEEVFSTRAIRKLASRLYKQYIRELKDTEGENKYLAQEIRTVEQQITNVVEAITIGGQIKTLVEQLKSLEMRKAILEARLLEWRHRHEQSTFSLENIAAYLKAQRELLRSKDPVQIKQVLERFIEKVVVNPESIEITFKVTVDTHGYPTIK